MCKLRQRGRGCGGPAGSRAFDPSLQRPPAVAREAYKEVTLLTMRAQKKAMQFGCGPLGGPEPEKTTFGRLGLAKEQVLASLEPFDSR
jgi:hypothetical protein